MSRVVTAQRFVVYALHLADGEYRYIGVTDNPGRRKLAHIRDAKNGSLAVHRWIRKHPDFQMTVIDERETYEQALAMEMYWIAAAGRYTLLNATDGGQGLRGYKHTSESKAIISASRKGHVKTDSELEANRVAHLGKKASAATKAKLSAQRLGNQWAKGYQHSEETKAKMSADRAGTNNLIGYKQTPEHVANRTGQQKGKPHVERNREESDARRAHTRWHVKRGILKLGCPLCFEKEMSYYSLPIEGGTD